MKQVFSFAIGASRRRPLAACVASVFALSAPAVSMAANNWVVSNCNDDGPNSLRAIIGAVTTLSGDSVDMTALSCTVTLTTGEITIGQNDLKIKGGGASQLTIDASQLDSGYTAFYDSRIFTHTGTGELKIYGMSLINGHSNHVASGYPALGGCVYSKGSVGIYGSVLSTCSASSQADKGAGGAIYAKGSVFTKYTVISGNSVFAGKNAYGGGVRALGGFIGWYTTVDGNSVQSSKVDPNAVGTWKYAIGGGVSTPANVTLLRSTISSNTSNGSFAGIDNESLASPSTNVMTVYSSTISGNHADRVVGGVYSNGGTAKFYNSTIAFNTAGAMNVSTTMTDEFLGPGLALSSSLNDVNVTLQSTLLSDNTVGSSNEFDLTTAFDSDPMLSVVKFNVSPANNFIRTSIHVNALPDDTIQYGSCAHLGQLRDNGGFVKTHALMSNSPAIDQGNNSLNDPTPSVLWAQDQRGLYLDVPPYLYPRESNGIADIGAFEINQNDTIFVTNHEGCIVLI